MNSLQLFTFNKRFLQASLTKDSFPQRGFMFPEATCFLEQKDVRKLGSHRIYFLTEVLLFHKHTDSPIMGASDMSQVSTYPVSRPKPIIWPLIRTQEGNKSHACSQDL